MGRRPFARVCLAVLAVMTAFGGSGCTGISVEPSCPAELVVGESGTLQANEKDEGAIAKYTWEVLPPEAGVLDSADQPTATFEAATTGKVTFRLTASDGLYQVVSLCTSEIITFANIAVTLTPSPTDPVAGETITLTCETGRFIPKGTRTIVQVAGESVELTVVAEGQVTFAASGDEDLSFRCTAESGNGEQAESSLLTITIPPSTDDQTDDGDDSGGDDEDDSGNDNGNDNGADPTPRPPARR